MSVSTLKIPLWRKQLLSANQLPILTRNQKLKSVPFVAVSLQTLSLTSHFWRQIYGNLSKPICREGNLPRFVFSVWRYLSERNAKSILTLQSSSKQASYCQRP